VDTIIGVVLYISVLIVARKLKVRNLDKQKKIERTETAHKIWDTLRKYKEDVREGGGDIGFYEWSKKLAVLLDEVEYKIERGII
jgi:biotin-(acetyl-CoA carboxylase) ligase